MRTIWPVSPASGLAPALACAIAMPADISKELPMTMPILNFESFIACLQSALTTAFNGTGSRLGRGYGTTPKQYVAIETARAPGSMRFAFIRRGSRSRKAMSFELLPQLELLDLAGRGVRNCVHEHHVVRNLSL